jgi:hypothetical protein
MRINEPLPAEMAVTSDGDVPTLWLLEHGVLSTRAVIPGYPAFSAAVEMKGVVPPGASGAELRSAATPHLPGLIDQATRMLILLADRLPNVKEPVRQRLTTLLLGSAVAGLHRDHVMGLPIIPVREESGRRFETPTVIAALADERGGVLTGTGSGENHPGRSAGPRVEVGPEEIALLTKLTGARIERRTGGHRPAEAGRRLLAAIRKVWNRIRALLGPGPLAAENLSADEDRLVSRLADAGVELALVSGSGSPRQTGSRHFVGRDRTEVIAASWQTGSPDVWIYPTLLAITSEDLEMPDGLRERWLESVTET